MSFEVWLAFVAASAALLAVPGPVVMLLFSTTLGRGRSVSIAAVPGVVLGDFAAMTVSLMGAGAVLSASATLFTILKILGAAYLVWLGIQMWRTDAKPLALKTAARNRSRLTVFRQAFLVTAFNPKDIVFFVAFLPQFINPAEPPLAQIITIEVTFLAMVLISNLLWIFLCGTLRDGLKNPATLRFVNRLGAGCLIGAGAFTALGRNSA
ncbi:LysE family translocator [Denitrobaculum tricleocarpae]|uniref:LysE family translocator n=1 Tax=Denitrobaculum tricleocarpae TaxID=2591009 RepID=A0A545TRU1_9PROT|nr:LysE family translocator [Denitrobaculum tricleocarpae]TQV79933.1 LysE family translocator [Denitrobaculum tricleocarpae]